MTHHSEEEGDAADDAPLRDKLGASGFKPNADGMRWAAAQPKILVAGAYKAIRTAAERAARTMGKTR